MRSIHFYKYQGTGNDFIMLDNRDGEFNDLSQAEITRLCERRFGIGADGLLLLNDHEDYDFEMVYYNSDGKKASMCGNGGRCIVAFANEIGVIDETCHFLAPDGEHQAEIVSHLGEQSLVKLLMKDVNQVRMENNAVIVDTGSPHYVTFVDNFNFLDVKQEGRKIRNSPEFPQGINVDFVEVLSKGLFVRTYERGVEDETYSCGTGVVAAAIAHSMKHQVEDMPIHTRGGELQVFFKKNKKDDRFSDIYLQGLVGKVFEGTMEW